MQMLYRLSYVGSDAARGKIGCEQRARRQEPASPRRQQRKASRTGQKIPSRPSPRGKRSPVSENEAGYRVGETRVNKKFDLLFHNPKNPDLAGGREVPLGLGSDGKSPRERSRPPVQPWPFLKAGERRVSPYPGTSLMLWITVENWKKWSGKRDSNPRPSAWKADALATELFPLETP
jgi:hypothetical protein